MIITLDNNNSGSFNSKMLRCILKLDKKNHQRGKLLVLKTKFIYLKFGTAIMKHTEENGGD